MNNRLILCKACAWAGCDIGVQLMSIVFCVHYVFFVNLNLQILHKHCPYLMGPIECLRDDIYPEDDIKVNQRSAPLT